MCQRTTLADEYPNKRVPTNSTERRLLFYPQAQHMVPQENTTPKAANFTKRSEPFMLHAGNECLEAAKAVERHAQVKVMKEACEKNMTIP